MHTGYSNDSREDDRDRKAAVATPTYSVACRTSREQPDLRQPLQSPEVPQKELSYRSDSAFSQKTYGTDPKNVPARIPRTSRLQREVIKDAKHSEEQMLSRKSSIAQLQASLATFDNQVIANDVNMCGLNLDSRELEDNIPINMDPSSRVFKTLGQTRSPPKKGQKTHLKTFKRRESPTDIANLPEISQRGFSLALKLAAPVFTGGGTIEGEILVKIDHKKFRGRSALFSTPASTTSISSVSMSELTVDVLGIETCQDKKNIFQSLAMELVDEEHPPPAAMVSSFHTQGPDWDIAPCVTKLAFCLSLPVEMGPPPYQSKSANVQYFVSVTAKLKIDGRPCSVRTSREIDILTVQDPSTILVNMKKPLVATDTLRFTHYGRLHELNLTAGVHRRTWISGSPLYTDVHICNKTNKHVRKINLSLEKITLFYGHSAITSDATIAEHLRMPVKTQTQIVAKSCKRPDTRRSRRGWLGVSPNSQDESTCVLRVPADLVTIDTGRYFCVKYFLTVEVGFLGKKLLVRVPIVLIHPNSLDIIPNSIAQVTRSIQNARRRDESKDCTKSLESDYIRSYEMTAHNMEQQRASFSSSLERQDNFLRDQSFESPFSESVLNNSASANENSSLQLDFPIPPSHKPQYNSSKFLCPQLRADIHSRSLSKLEPETKDTEPLVGPIMSRSRPWARSFNGQTTACVRKETECMVKSVDSCEAADKIIVEHESIARPGSNENHCRSLQSPHGDRSKLIDLQSQGNDDHSEEIDTYMTDRFSGGLGLDIGQRSLQSIEGSTELPERKSPKLRLQGSLKIQQTPYKTRSFYLQPPHQDLNSGNGVTPETSNLKRCGGVFDSYHRGHPTSPKFHMKRLSEDLRRSLGRTESRVCDERFSCSGSVQINHIHHLALDRSLGKNFTPRMELCGSYNTVERKVNSGSLQHKSLQSCKNPGAFLELGDISSSASADPFFGSFPNQKFTEMRTQQLELSESKNGSASACNETSKTMSQHSELSRLDEFPVHRRLRNLDKDFFKKAEDYGASLSTPIPNPCFSLAVQPTSHTRSQYTKNFLDEPKMPDSRPLNVIPNHEVVIPDFFSSQPGGIEKYRRQSPLADLTGPSSSDSKKHSSFNVTATNVSDTFHHAIEPLHGSANILTENECPQHIDSVPPSEDKEECLLPAYEQNHKPKSTAPTSARPPPILLCSNKLSSITEGIAPATFVRKAGLWMPGFSNVSIYNHLTRREREAFVWARNDPEGWKPLEAWIKDHNYAEIGQGPSVPQRKASRNKPLETMVRQKPVQGAGKEQGDSSPLQASHGESRK